MMDAKKIKLHDYHLYGSQQLFPAAGGLSFHPAPGLMSSLPQPPHAGWLHEDHHTTTPRSVLATHGSLQGSRCVGSDAAAFFAAEELMMGMPRFDDCPLGGTEMTAFAKRPTTEDEQLYYRRPGPVDPLPLRDSAAVRTYYVRPQQRDGATEAPISLELPFQRGRRQQQQLFGTASTGRLLGGEPKAHSFTAHVSKCVESLLLIEVSHSCPSPNLLSG
jgi:hypothetical protein